MAEQERMSLDPRPSRIPPEQFEVLFAEAPCGIIVADREGRIVASNQSAATLFGWTREELSGQPLEMLLPERFRARHVLDRRAFRPSRHYQMATGRRLCGLKRDGSEVSLSIGLAEIGGPDRPEEQLVAAFFVDPSEQDNAEQRYRALFEHALDAVLVLDQGGVVQEHNPNALTLLGRPPGDVRGQRFVTLLDHTASPVDPATLERLVLGGDLRSQQVSIARPDGERVVADASVTTIDIGQGRLLFVILRDVTEQRRTQAQLQMSDRMATVGTLAAGVAHEINNPLAAVIANVDLALRDLAQVAADYGGELRPIHDELKDARDAAERVRQIVRDLRIFSRAEADVVVPVDVERVLDSSLRIAWNEIRHSARVVKDYGRVSAVACHESRLGQVFLNLLVNAAQAIPQGHADENEIRVSTRMATPRDVVIEIRDSGCGMTPEVLRRLFTPFFTTKAEGVGTGLGLSISSRIVKDLGGEISAESCPGRGSCFRIRLPAAVPATTDAPGKRSAAPRASRRARILVVDDEPVVLKAVQRILSLEHEVTTVTSAVEVVERVRGGQFYDVILTDLMMPQMSGMELFAELTRVAPEQAARVIFLTGGAFSQPARAFLDEVRNPRIEKPFDAQQLRTLINGIVH